MRGHLRLERLGLPAFDALDFGALGSFELLDRSPELGLDPLLGSRFGGFQAVFDVRMPRLEPVVRFEFSDANGGLAHFGSRLGDAIDDPIHLQARFLRGGLVALAAAGLGLFARAVGGAARFRQGLAFRPQVVHRAFRGAFGAHRLRRTRNASPIHFRCGLRRGFRCLRRSVSRRFRLGRTPSALLGCGRSRGRFLSWHLVPLAQDQVSEADFNTLHADVHSFFARFGVFFPRIRTSARPARRSGRKRHGFDAQSEIADNTCSMSRRTFSMLPLPSTNA